LNGRPLVHFSINSAKTHHRRTCSGEIVGAHSRRKGKRCEREIVALARAAGLPATRTWQTAQDADSAVRCCDVEIRGYRAQVRIRGNGFKAVYEALEAVEVAFLRERLLALLANERGLSDP